MTLMKYNTLVVEDSKEDAAQLRVACTQAGYQTFARRQRRESPGDGVDVEAGHAAFLILRCRPSMAKAFAGSLREDERGRAIPVIMISAPRSGADILPVLPPAPTTISPSQSSRRNWWPG